MSFQDLTYDDGQSYPPSIDASVKLPITSVLAIFVQFTTPLRLALQTL